MDALAGALHCGQRPWAHLPCSFLRLLGSLSLLCCRILRLSLCNRLPLCFCYKDRLRELAALFVLAAVSLVL